MLTTNNKISVAVTDQLPEFVREDHETFVQFLKSYYDFLELSSPPVDVPLIKDNPNSTVYNTLNPYGGTYQVAEIIEQRANTDNPNEVTAKAKVFAWNADDTTPKVTVTEISGTQGKFIKGFEIVGLTSGAKYWPTNNIKGISPGATQASNNIRSIRDLDESLDEYIDYIKDDVARALPFTLDRTSNVRTVLKNIRDFYKARGTESSFKLLFRLAFGEDIDIYQPKDDMLRASVGDWFRRQVIRTTVPTLDPNTQLPVTASDFTGKQIRGNQSLATAIVEKVNVVVYLGKAFAELELSSKVGTFLPNETIRAVFVSADTNQTKTVEAISLGMITNIDVVDGGSNYSIGDRLTFTDPFGVGALAEVDGINETTGAVTSVKILDPGYNYINDPIITLDLPHSGDAGLARFETGTLKTVFYETFDDVLSANDIFAESDNRGISTNVVAIGDSSTVYDIDATMVTDPSLVNANSYGNFVTIPGKESGLQAWWKFSNYHNSTVKINTLDGTFGDGNDPAANTVFVGPRVGDSVYSPDMSQPPFGYGDDDVLKNRLPYSDDPTTTNTYSSANWIGFKPIIFDHSGNRNHAWLQTRSELSGGPFRANVVTGAAFKTDGIYGSTSNSFVTGPYGPGDLDRTDLGGVVLRAHDDIRNANTQTWTFWYYPHGDFGYFSNTYQNDNEWRTFDSTSFLYNSNNAPRIISRGRTSHWALMANLASASISAGDYIDCLFTFTGGVLDNGTSLDAPPGAGATVQLANTSGLYPGSATGALNSGGGNLRAQTWNMIALSIDYTNHVGNIYFFNTIDGLHSSNGFSIAVDQDANTSTHGTSNSGWVPSKGLIEGRAVVLGAESASANGDSNTLEENPARKTKGRFNEVRYYDTALSEQQIIKLFKNPGGRFNNTLTGGWALTNYDSSFNVNNPVIALPYIENVNTAVLRIGSADSSYANGVQLVWNQNIPFDPLSHYKITVKAKDTDATNSSNVEFGIIGISNTGTSLIGYDGSDDWAKMHSIVQSSVGNEPAESGSLGEDWFEYSAVFGGNTSNYGWSDSISLYQGTGGNTAQEASGEATTFTWNNPAKLYGSLSVTTQQGSGNAEYFRPVLTFKDWNQDFYTDIQYVKVEVAQDARFSSDIGGEFTWPGEYQSDAGKLSTSIDNQWKSKFLSDNDLYQIYSYVIRSGLSLNIYKDLVYQLVHVAGNKLFGRVDIETEVSVAIKAFSETFTGNIVDLFLDFYLGAESSLIEDFDGLGIAERTNFGLYDLSSLSHNLNLAHGQFDYGDGPGWIAWDQSPLDNPYALSNYGDIKENYPGTFNSSLSKTNVTHDSLIYEIYGRDSKLVTGYANTSASVYALDGQDLWLTDDPEGQNGIYQHNLSYGMPLDIDGTDYRYVRMKVRRIGPGGYGNDSWSGACQCEINPSARASYGTPRLHNSAGANTISQPSTLVLPSTASESDTSPWHILEWDMWKLGVDGVISSPNWPVVDPSEAWKAANSASGTSPREGGSGRRVGWIGISLTDDPDNSNERFEIDWIQVDNGVGWRRGSHIWPSGVEYGDTYPPNGIGSGGLPNSIHISDTVNQDHRLLEDFAVSVEPAVGHSSIEYKNAPVIYTSSQMSTKYIDGDGSPIELNQVVSGAGAIFRASANTANSLDWVVTELINSHSFMVGQGILSDNTVPRFDGPVILDTDTNDNLFVGYTYSEEAAYYPSLANNLTSDSRPLVLFKLSPTANTQSNLNLTSDGHNLYGRSNTYNIELIMFGNTAGHEILAAGPTTYGSEVLGSFADDKAALTIDSFVDTTDDATPGALHILGGGSQNVIKLVHAANGSFADDLTTHYSRFNNQWMPGRLSYELANTTMLDANGMVLGSWEPHHMIQGPKGSIFVACNTGVRSSETGANTIYCYQIVVSQNTASGEYYTSNIHPVYSNSNYTIDKFQGCVGMTLDHEDPPNLYYATPNTVYKITPKGYNYENGNSKIVQLFGDTEIADTFDYPEIKPALGKYNDSFDDNGIDIALDRNNYIEMKSDRMNRIYFAGRSNIYCYDTKTSVLEKVYTPNEHSSNIDYTTHVDPDTDRINIISFDVDPKTSDVFFTMRAAGIEASRPLAYSPPHPQNKKLLGYVRPNANMSFNITETGQISGMLIIHDASDTSRFETKTSGGSSYFEGYTAGETILRKPKG